MTFTNFLLVAIGGALGSLARYLVGIAAGRLFGPAFPWGTVIVNIVGSTVMGLFIGALALASGSSAQLRLFVAVGVLGGFTTLSSFALDSVTLAERGDLLAAVGYVAGTLVLSIGGLAAGLAVVRGLA